MKKYVFMVLFFLGCFFVSLTTSIDIVSATSSTITADSFDSKRISIFLEELSARANVIKIHEIEYCNEGEEGCNAYNVGAETLYFKSLNSKEYSVALSNTLTSVTLEYTIESEEDGMKSFFVEPIDTLAGQDMTRYYHIFEYKLSTLNQRVVLNPDGNGKPLHLYDDIQYTAVTTLNVKIDLLEEEINDLYSGIAYICEEGALCSDYDISEGMMYFPMMTYGDGFKKINVYLVKKNNTIVEDNTMEGRELFLAELAAKSTLISKSIYLDRIGPQISLDGKTVEGSEWVYIEAGKVYTVQEATCKDDIFPNDKCSVTNDSDIVKIDYTSDKHQFVTYEATDRLGNVTSVQIKIKVEVAQKESNIMFYILIPVGVMVVTGAILGYILIKNHEKKKKISYI